MRGLFEKRLHQPTSGPCRLSELGAVANQSDASVLAFLLMISRPVFGMLSVEGRELAARELRALASGTWEAELPDLEERSLAKCDGVEKVSELGGERREGGG